MGFLVCTRWLHHPTPPMQTSGGAHTVGPGFSADGAVLETPPSKPPGACLFQTPMVCLAGSGTDFDPTLGRLIFWGLGSSITSSRSPMGRTGAAGPSPVLDAVGAGLASLPRAPAWHGWGLPPLPLPVVGARRPALCCLHRNVENGATVSMAACDGSCEAPPRTTASGHRSAPENCNSDGRTALSPSLMITANVSVVALLGVRGAMKSGLSG